MNRVQDIKGLLSSALEGGDILFIVTPFARRGYSVLAPHILQAIAREMGYKAEILYLSILFDSIIGDKAYERISTNPYNLRWMKLGERLFARSAHRLPPLGKSAESLSGETTFFTGSRRQRVKTAYEGIDFDLDDLLKLEERCFSFVNEAVKIIASFNYKMIGCTTMLDQTNCSVAVLEGIKKIHPGIITLIGGTDCEGEMAEGVASLTDAIDYIFSGESERTFRDFLIGYSRGKLPSRRVIKGEPLMEMDTLPMVDYESFFKQMQLFIGDNLPKMKAVTYETSRGCWWGQKQKCTYCGNNDNHSLAYRQKSGEKVMKELEHIAENYPTDGILMVDNIIPRSYYKKILPLLARKEGYPVMWYQESAVLTIEELMNLKKARITSLVIGIETLSTGMLKLMNKSVKAKQNLLFLRNALSAGLYIGWFMLWGFPGDKAAFYEETLELFPLIKHLQPPGELIHLALVRFSSYVERPELYQITNLRPVENYEKIYPHWAEVDKIAYYFTGDYPCEAHENPELIEEIANQIEIWQESWEKVNLNMIHIAGQYCIFDSRKINGEDRTFTLDYARAREVMKYSVYSGSEHQKWAVYEKLGVIVDSWYVPLVTASPELLLEFES